MRLPRIGVLSGVLALVLAVTGLPPLFGQDAAGDGPSAHLASAGFEPREVRAGGEARLRIEISIAEGSHLYAQTEGPGKAPEFAWTLPAGWSAGALRDVSEPHEFTGFGDREMVHEGTLVLEQTFTLTAVAATGAATVTASAEWQVCDANLCAFATDVPLSATATVLAAEADGGAGGPDVAAPGGGAGVAPPSPSAPPAPGLSWAFILGQAVLWGFVTCLTPCVFPLLPITVSFFSKQKGPALPRATVYALGIVFTITVIGLVFKSGLDVMARDWLFNGLVGLLFLALALSLFGLFDLRLPSFLTNWASQKGSEGGGLAGPFFMAVTLALTSFSCSMPFLAVMFTQFERGNATQAVTGLVVYGSTMALPFFLCSLFPSALSALPRAGEWMQAVKVTMGFVEFALAFKFFRTVALNFGSDALPRGFVLALWAACAIGAAFYLFGWIVLPHDTKPESIGVIRLVFALGFLGSAIYLVNGVNGRPLADWLEGFLQTQPQEIAAAGGGGERGGHIPWQKNDWDGALRQSRETGRPVLFDFTGVG